LYRVWCLCSLGSYFRLSYVSYTAWIQGEIIQGISHLLGQLDPTQPDLFAHRESLRFLLATTGTMLSTTSLRLRTFIVSGHWLLMNFKTAVRHRTITKRS
jgi:hypothetical protein